MTSIYNSQPDDTTGIDTYIESVAPTTNYGASLFFVVGKYGTATDRTLIKFDLSSITFPTNGIVESAVLSVWIKTDASGNARDYKVYRLLRNWVEAQATWNIYSTGNNWTTAGCGGAGTDYDSTVWAATNFSATETVGTEKQFVLDTAEMAKMLDGTYTNYGWMIKADTENNDGYALESSGSATAAYRPKLYIAYRERKSVGVIGNI